VEITHNALPVTAHPFRRSTAFLFGNEVGGSDFLMIPH
jgi:hypothetical protein